MNLTWLNNGFISNDLYAPYVLERDSEYIDALRKKYDLVLKQAKNAGSDGESIRIIQKYRKKYLNL